MFIWVGGVRGKCKEVREPGKVGCNLKPRSAVVPHLFTTPHSSKQTNSGPTATCSRDLLMKCQGIKVYEITKHITATHLHAQRLARCGDTDPYRIWREMRKSLQGKGDSRGNRTREYSCPLPSPESLSALEFMGDPCSQPGPLPLSCPHPCVLQLPAASATSHPPAPHWAISVLAAQWPPGGQTESLQGNLSSIPAALQTRSTFAVVCGVWVATHHNERQAASTPSALCSYMWQ